MDGTSLKGKHAYDRVCPSTTETSCANDFRFVAITKQDGLSSNEDGILGMWSGNVSGYDTTEMFMYKMAADSDIDANIFSFYLTGEDSQSYIDFGTPNAAVSTDAPIYIDIDDENEWFTADITGFRWGEGRSEYELKKARSAITDTGTSCIIGPRKEVKRIMRKILNKVDGRVYWSWGTGWEY